MWSTTRWQRLTEALPHEKTTPFVVRVRETAEGSHRSVDLLPAKLPPCCEPKVETRQNCLEKKKRSHEGKMFEPFNNCKMMCTRVTKVDWFNVANWIHIVHSCISFKNFKQKKKLRGKPRYKVKERLMLKGFRSCRRRTRTTTTTTMTMNHQEKKPDQWSILGQVLGYIPPKRVLRFRQNSRHQKRKFNKRPHPKSWEEQLLITSRVNLIRF